MVVQLIFLGILVSLNLLLTCFGLARSILLSISLILIFAVICTVYLAFKKVTFKSGIPKTFIDNLTDSPYMVLLRYDTK